MLKRIASIILGITIIVSLTTMTSAATTTLTVSTTLDRANALRDLGLFMGSDKGFDLDRAPTRGESIVMLLRMLGKEDEAKNSSYTNPFNDVPDWAACYIPYAYAKGYTSGTSKTTFGTNNIVTPEQFLTFMLRALGYSDKDGEFTLNTAIQKAETLKIVPVGKYKVGGTFYRSDCVDIIYSVLSATKKPDNVTIAKYLIDSKAIDVATAAKYGFATPAPKYQMVRVPLVNDTNIGLIIKGSDVRAAITGAKYVSMNWDDSIGLTDYEKAFDIDLYKDMVNPNKSSDLADYLMNNYQAINKYKQQTKTARIVVAAYDEKANMIAAAIDVAMDAEKNGYLDFALVSVNGEAVISKLDSEFEKAFGNPVEYKDAIAYIEKAAVNWTYISKKTGKVVSTSRAADIPDSKPCYRYVIDKAKYPELAEKTIYLGDDMLPTGKSAYEALKEFGYRWFKSSNFNGTFNTDGPIINFGTGGNKWTENAAEWNNPRYLSFADVNRKLIGCTSFVPSQLKVIDVGTVDQIAYVD